MCGILVGFMLAFDLFAWFNDYLFLCAGIWVLLGLLVSTKLTTQFPLPCIRILESDEIQDREMSIVNGAIVYHPEAGAPVNGDMEESL